MLVFLVGLATLGGFDRPLAWGCELSTTRVTCRGAARKTSIRAALGGIFYRVRTGCP